MITDSERLEFIEQATRRSRTGVSLEWIPAVEGETSGFRFLHFHDIGETKPTVRDAIDAAIAKATGKSDAPGTAKRQPQSDQGAE